MSAKGGGLGGGEGGNDSIPACTTVNVASLI